MLGNFFIVSLNHGGLAGWFDQHFQLGSVFLPANTHFAKQYAEKTRSNKPLTQCKLMSLGSMKISLPV